VDGVAHVLFGIFRQSERQGLFEILEGLSVFSAVRTDERQSVVSGRIELDLLASDVVIKTVLHLLKRALIFHFGVHAQAKSQTFYELFVVAGIGVKSGGGFQLLDRSLKVS
jgi:hypothetical protein